MGKLKNKGAYAHEREWHQNQSALVIPKAVEAHLIRGESIREFIENHDDIYDFMLRVKLPRNYRLEIHSDGEVYPLRNIQRYHVAKQGGVMKKVMPPLPGKDTERVQDIESGWLVAPCNNMKDAIRENINYEYYIEQAEKLILELH